MSKRFVLLCLFAAGCVGAPGPVDETDESLTACPGKNVVVGIDVSAYQPNTNWASVKKAGRAFGIVKATEGTGYTNPYFAHDWSGMKSAGVIRGAYHFFHANLDPIAQADHFVSVMGKLVSGDLPPMLDLEVTDGEPASTVLSRAKAFLAEVKKKTGRNAILYTYPDFWLNQLGNPGGFGADPLNMADYGACPPLPASWKAVTFWQYTSSGSVAGVSGNVDEDKFYGTLAELELLASGYVVQGAILTEYDKLGGPSGVLGLPTTDERATPDGIGRYNHFQHGSIYWTSKTGAHEVHGPIATKWASLGWEKSALGYPIEDEYKVTGGLRSDFQHGSLVLDGATGVVTEVLPNAGGSDGGTSGGAVDGGGSGDGGAAGAPSGDDGGGGGGDPGANGDDGSGDPGARGAVGMKAGGCSVAGGAPDGATALVLLALALAAVRRRVRT